MAKKMSAEFTARLQDTKAVRRQKHNEQDIHLIAMHGAITAEIIGFLGSEVGNLFKVTIELEDATGELPGTDGATQD